MKHALLSALRLYKARISPQLPAACRYTPTCSEYAIEAIERRGVVVGSALAVKRVLSCNPFSRGGYDPVPQARAR
ncbi:MAG: membrane protein insertion efficiency factor YidD [Chloroflexota bacterium]|nr:membrane protein insertion efficiency factor YidD [Chloroflexota bacterium]